ncbi:MAG: Rpn family recombination-promoting nuclease/putative transposase [Planctomycetia bacterium]|nr:Rpn family recombination-promoting nuclease/putative transposase [Planctomycetia bacterium]
MIQTENAGDNTSEFKSPIPTMSDIFVHFLFGTKKYESALICFLNAVLTDTFQNPIKAVTVKNPFSFQTYMHDKSTVLDIVVEDEQSRAFDIEIQIANHKYFVERTLYYWAKLYSSQLKKNESYNQLKPVISIILTDFQVFQEIDLLHSSFSVRSNDEQRYLLTDHFEMHFLRVP